MSRASNPDFRLHRAPCFICRFHELLDKLAAHRKKLMRNRLFIRVLPLIHNNRHINLRTEPEQFSKHTDLHRRKSGKPIHQHLTVFDQRRFFQLPRQNFQHILRRHITVFQIFLKRAVDHTGVLQFCRQQLFLPRLFRPRIKLGRRNLVLLQLGDQRFHLRNRTGSF